MRPPQNPNRAGKATLVDIARSAGVSTITASRALHGGLPVAEATRARILAAATDLGYTPNLLARGLVQNRTSTIGVIIIEIANPFFAPMVSAIEGVAAKHGFLAVVAESRRDVAAEQQFVERFQQMRVGGIIVTALTPQRGHLVAARSNGTPVVVMARRWKDGDYVTADNEAGGRLAAEHLLERGHRRIGLVYPRDPGNNAMQDRIRGFRRTLASAGVTLPDRWDFHTRETFIIDGKEAADGLLALSGRPSALFVATDRQAMGTVSRLLSGGVRVPEDIAVVGYDDIPYAECSRVPLTTVAIPVERIGEVSAEILFDRLDHSGPSERRQIRLLPELVIRASSP